MLTYNLNHISFSMPGSYLTLSARNTSGSNRLLYQTCSRRAFLKSEMPSYARNFFELALLRDGVEVPYTWTAQPHRLDLQTKDGGSATFAFADTSTICFETRGVTLRLLPCKVAFTTYSPAAGVTCLVDWVAYGHHVMRAGQNTEIKLTPSSTVASPTYDSNQGTPYKVDFAGSGGAFRFSPYEHLGQEPIPALSKIVAAREKEWQAWLRRLPNVPSRYRLAAEHAWLILWVLQVQAAGLLTRPIILQSKFTMNQIWAWDNCFSAMAIARADPQAAWNELLLFFEHADPNGMIPDSINDTIEHFCFVKAPIYGWTIKKLVKRLGAKRSLPYLKDLYIPMCRLTEWWYAMRDSDHDGICQYHHGNDSGWDNSTAFDQGYPSEAADLSAHLVLQCEGLAFMADLLGKKRDAQRWAKRAQKQLANFLQHSVQDHHFISPMNGTHTVEPSQSLINYVPIELGHRLPPDIRDALIADLKPGGAFLTDFGLATESPRSPKYESDGYWRGPIWAASTFQIFDGLVDAGELGLARTIAERFCDLCAQDLGFWENFDALTGKGLRCPGYSWTAAVFVLLAEWLAGRGFEGSEK